MSEHPKNFQTDFAWYKVISSTQPLEQGDFLRGFPLIRAYDSFPGEPSANPDMSEPTEAPVDTGDVIVMTQSCDLSDFLDTDHVILCPIFSIKEAKDSKGKSLNNSDKWGNLRKGNYIYLHLLNKCELQNFEFDYQIIDLRRIYSVPLGFVKQFATDGGDRIRLLPPYREHLAQAFARQFMRVGLPYDLPADPYKKITGSQ